MGGLNDRYSKAIRYFKRNPNKIQHAWEYAHGAIHIRGACLFKGLKADKPHQNVLTSGGCLTQVKYQGYNAPTPELTEMILADDSIPANPTATKMDANTDLRPFAKYQRLADKARKELAKVQVSV